MSEAAALPRDVAEAGALEQRGQSAPLRDYLLSTTGRVLVEASPSDRVWGIGLEASDGRATRPSQWKGLNLLSFALMDARDHLAAGELPVFVAVDVHYLNDAVARAAVVAAVDRTFSRVAWTKTAMVTPGAPYRPGEFFRRELPALRAVVPAGGQLALIVVDGYVDLDPGGRPGLGAHVRAEYGVPVIGVAKTAFRSATHAAQVLRGQSRRPLYVTSAGISITEAALVVSEMNGRFRLPDALKLADRLAHGTG